MDGKHVTSLAGELETTLELLSQLVEEIQRTRSERESDRIQELCAALSRRPNLAELPKVLLRAYAEITEALGGIRLTRETIQAHAVERIHDTHDKLNEVTSATESAAMEMLNGLDRTLATIDELQKATASAGTEQAAGFDALRAEVNNLYNCLQFQDITAQQMRGASQLLNDVETRIEGVASLFDHAMGTAPAGSPTPVAGKGPELAFNPDATMKDTEHRQAQADATFQVARQPAPDAPALLSPGIAR